VETYPADITFDVLSWVLYGVSWNHCISSRLQLLLQPQVILLEIPIT